jgi:antirestriction protein ArdC
MTVYDIITNQIIDQLQAGVAPWRKPWACAAAGAPANFVTKRPYSGINTLLLGMSAYASPYWLTYKQAAALGGNVRKGEKGTAIVFWKIGERQTADGDTEKSFVLRYYTVFNIAQCDNLPDAAPVDAPREVQGIPAAEAIWQGYRDRPTLSTAGTAAFYNPAADSITLPAPASFTTDENFWATLFHEAAHSTGHSSRLDRLKPATFGSETYGKEELVAELAAAFLCADAGIVNTLPQSASYLQGWITALKGDSRLLITAAAAAQRAAHYITGKAPQQADAE